MKLFLDTGVLGMVTHPKTDEGHEAAKWLYGHVLAGATIVVPQICDYELRREYIRKNNEKSLKHLNDLIEKSEYALTTKDIWHKAANLWADCRNRGKRLADDHALDGDVILIATIKDDGNIGAQCIVATTNVKHLIDFVDARLFHEI